MLTPVLQENSTEALEAALIAALASEPHSYWQALQHLPPTSAEAFSVYHDLWRTLAQAIETGSPLPPLPASLGDGRVTSVEDAARALGDRYRRRALVSVHEQALERLREGQPLPDVTASVESAVAALRATTVTESEPLVWGDSLVAGALESAHTAHERQRDGFQALGLPTGMANLDRLLNGLNGSALYILGGAPGAGKTSLALQWSCHIVREARVPVVYVTFENTPQNLVFKALCREAGIGTGMVERGRADLHHLAEVAKAFAPDAMRIAFIPGSARTSVADLQARAQQAMAQFKSTRCLIVVDYLQRMAYRDSTLDQRASVAALSLGLRELSIRLDSPILAISSLSRGSDTYRRPTLQSLQGSEDLEFAADVVLLLGDREEKSLSSSALARSVPGARLLDLEVAKNRYGEANRRVSLFFKPALGDFQEDTRA